MRLDNVAFSNIHINFEQSIPQTQPKQKLFMRILSIDIQQQKNKQNSPVETNNSILNRFIIQMNGATNKTGNILLNLNKCYILDNC